MDENKANRLLKEFSDWYESTTGDDLSGYDRDTTPYIVWEFLAHSDDRHLSETFTRPDIARCICPNCGDIHPYKGTRKAGCVKSGG